MLTLEEEGRNNNRKLEVSNRVTAEEVLGAPSLIHHQLVDDEPWCWNSGSSTLSVSVNC